MNCVVCKRPILTDAVRAICSCGHHYCQNCLDGHPNVEEWKNETSAHGHFIAMGVPKKTPPNEGE